ncbi:hypothetical protein [Peribacillus tepidiphilus]|nr:hypothetical protein [Peribacillus tepidiphilus]
MSSKEPDPSQFNEEVGHIFWLNGNDVFNNINPLKGIMTSSS